MLDARMMETINKKPNAMVPWFLMAAYAYEFLNRPILSDETWDHLCLRLKREWRSLRHQHKWIIDPKQLISGTAHYLTVDDYPGVAIGAVTRLIEEHDYEQRLQGRRSCRRRRRVSS